MDWSEFRFEIGDVVQSKSVVGSKYARRWVVVARAISQSACGFERNYFLAGESNPEAFSLRNEGRPIRDHLIVDEVELVPYTPPKG